MLNAKAFANAATVVTAIFYLICWAASVILPDLVFSIGRSWMHSVNLDSLKATTQMPLTTAIWGLVTISLVTWVTAYITIRLYNYWAKK